jgi:gliding motility-associated-like protein
MLRNLTLTFLFILSATSAYSQLLVTNAPPFNTPQYLVQNVLIGGGIQATNVQYTGAPVALGFFNGVNTNIGLDSGVIITSGTIQNAVGPNFMGGTTGINGTAGYPLLSLYSGVTTFDAAILQFDFIPTSDTLRFRYVFGSEEYPEYVGGGVNDAFGFFISGPNPLGGNYVDQNLAITPGSTTPVTINTVNCQGFSSFYLCNDPNNDPSFYCAPAYNCPTNAAQTTIQYDGFTIPLTAEALVVCGQVYTIKMAIADGGDGILDSGVFLEAGSFSSPTLTINTVASFTYGPTDTALVEGCGIAYLEFLRNGNLQDTLEVTFTLGGTATNGVDYGPVPNSIVLLPDSTTYNLFLNSVYDNVPEGTETIVITTDSIFTNCVTYPPVSITITLVDQLPLSIVDISDTTVLCPGDSLTIQAQASGGVGYYRYFWDDGSTDSIRVFSPSATTTYIVAATDTCGNQVVADTFQVVVPVYAPLDFSIPDVLICLGDEVEYDPVITGGSGNYTIAWSTGDMVSNVTYTMPYDTLIYLTVSDDCGNVLVDSSLINVSGIPMADYDYLNVANQSITFQNLSTGATSYFWDFGNGDISNDQSPTYTYITAGTFAVQLIAVNDDGCADTIVKTVDVYANFYFYVPNAFTPNNDGLNDWFGGRGEGYNTYQMQIYSRWGQLVFESDDPFQDWDGKMKSGEDALEGSYLYKFVLTLPLSTVPVEYTGYLNLIR